MYFIIVAEVISYYLATHCMLAHNEARQNLMIKKYEEAVKLLPKEENHDGLERFTTDHSLPDDYCKLISIFFTLCVIIFIVVIFIVPKKEDTNNF